ncbi:MAG: Uma2 family endonuclease [Spirochaetota bacterium]|nr:Uma2 family endonuclease [Spirochaetota bacterium]
MATTKQKVWTYSDYTNLTDDNRYEILEGELIEMAPAPNYFHQTILAKLFNKLYNFSEENNLGDVRCSPLDIIFDDHNTLQPDIIYVSNDNKKIIKEKGVFGPPDLVIEILSQSTVTKDREIKFSIYEKFKVKEYWIVDPENKSVDVFCLEANNFSLHASSKDKIKSKLFPNLEITLKDIFNQ